MSNRYHRFFFFKQSNYYKLFPEKFPKLSNVYRKRWHNIFCNHNSWYASFSVEGFIMRTHGFNEGFSAGSSYRICRNPQTRAQRCVVIHVTRPKPVAKEAPKFLATKLWTTIRKGYWSRSYFEYLGKWFELTFIVHLVFLSIVDTLSEDRW